MGLLRMRELKRLILLLFTLLLPMTVFSENSDNVDQSFSVGSAYYFSDNKGYDLSGMFAPISYSPIYAINDNERDLGTTWGGAELKGTYKISLTEDFLTGGSALTADNSIKYTFKADLTPVNFETGGEVTLSPIAFLDFTLGSTIASGWTAIGIVGLGLYDEDTGTNEDAFQGVLSQSWLTGTFKFDTAAIMSGDKTWKHIIILTSHTLKYKYFSAAGEDDSWVYQASEADNYNGFTYSTTSVLAYQMPKKLNMIGILVDTDTNLFSNSERSTMDSGGWGSDFVEIRFGGLFNIKFNENHSLAILPQLITRPHYTDETVSYSNFLDRVIDTDDPFYIDFDRIALNYTYKF